MTNPYAAARRTTKAIRLEIALEELTEKAIGRRPTPTELLAALDDLTDPQWQAVADWAEVPAPSGKTRELVRYFVHTRQASP